jgi:hypothetical protein
MKSVFYLLLLLPISSFARPIKVQVYSEGNSNSENLILSSINRELRALGDVVVDVRTPHSLEEAEIADKQEYDYKLTISILEISQGKIRSGYAFNCAVTTKIICEKADNLLTDYLRIANDDSFQVECKKLVADLDSEWFELVRKHKK